MKIAKLYLLTILILISTASFFAQPTRRPVSTGTPPSLKAGSEAEPNPVEDFPEKGLPEPANLGQKPSSALAVQTARRILKYDENSLAVLTAALQKAGFHIVDKDLKILFKPTAPVNGLAFYDFEVAGMLKSTGFGAVTTVEKIGKTFANNSPELTALNLPNLLLNDLRAARNSTDQQTQFVVSLIFELGKGTSDLSTAAPTDARINLIQASLIERIFLGEVLEAYEKFVSEDGASIWRKRSIFDKQPQFAFLNASFSNNIDGPCEYISDISKIAGFEGKVKKVGGKIFDKETIPSIWTKNKEWIKKNFEHLAEGIEHVNLVTSWMKLVVANMSIAADLTVEDPIPLIRTKSNRNTGEERIVTAKFRINFRHSETINCVAKGIKLASGLDLEVPKDGALSEVPVKWEANVEGSGYSRYTGYPVLIDAVDPVRRDISKQKTDKQGVSKIKLTGKPQAKNLENEPVVPKDKKADLTVGVATEDMEAKDDLQKIFWFGFDGDFGVKAFLEVLPDIMAKMALRNFKVTVPVRDWQPCSEEWGGYINYKRNLSKTTVVKSTRSSNGNSTGDGVRRITKEEMVNIVLNPRTKEEIAAIAPVKPADFRVRGKYTDIFEGVRESDPCCGPVAGKYSTKFREGVETKFFGVFQRKMYVSFSGGDRDFSLGFSFDSDLVNGQRHEFKEILDSNCPMEYADERSIESEFPAAVAGLLNPGRYGQRYLNAAGDLLQGTKETQLPDGSDITWEWALARCKP